MGLIVRMISRHNFRIWTLLIGIISIDMAIVKPKSLKYPYEAWMKLVHILKLVNGKIILDLIFLFALMPISLIMKIFSYDSLKQKNFINSYKKIRKVVKCI